MLTRFCYAIVLATLLVAGSATIAFADTIGPSCGSCYGATYTLTSLGKSLVDLAGFDNDTWRILLSVNTAGYTGGATDSIHSVAVKVSSGVDAALLESTDAPGSWIFYLGGNNAKGCDNHGAGFVCAQDPGVALTGGQIYNWIFDIDISGGLFTAVHQASIKVEYDNPNGSNAGITSEDITLGITTIQRNPVPEPGTLFLLGTGIASALARKCKRKRECQSQRPAVD